MKNLLKLGLTLAASVSLVHCASYQQPENPTGASLDRPASGERSARETRYLEQEVVESQGNPAPLPINPMPPADGTPPVDPAAIQAPMPPTTADTPPTPPPPTTTTSRDASVQSYPASPRRPHSIRVTLRRARPREKRLCLQPLRQVSRLRGRA